MGLPVGLVGLPVGLVGLLVGVVGLSVGVVGLLVVTGTQSSEEGDGMFMHAGHYHSMPLL